MLISVAKKIRRTFRNAVHNRLDVDWVKVDHGSRLAHIINMPSLRPNKNCYSRHIEQLASRTNDKGPQPLWNGYGSENTRGTERLPDDVRTDQCMGRFYTNLVQSMKPEVVVEFGTAFGVSGMYFLAGIELNKVGSLLTFEPNAHWADIAKQNLSSISDRYSLTVGTFEDNIGSTLLANQSIDLAFIDAIHTKEFVYSQLDIIISYATPGAIVILDDINFSDSMRECWESVSKDERVKASVRLGSRVGLLELDRPSDNAM